MWRWGRAFIWSFAQRISEELINSSRAKIIIRNQVLSIYKSIKIKEPSCAVRGGRSSVRSEVYGRI